MTTLIWSSIVASESNGGIVMSISNKDYLNELIAKAKKSWEGIDVDSYLLDVRYNLTEKENAKKEDAEKKQKALEKLKKVIENSSINKEHTKSNINF